MTANPDFHATDDDHHHLTATTTTTIIKNIVISVAMIEIHGGPYQRYQAHFTLM